MRMLSVINIKIELKTYAINSLLKVFNFLVFQEIHF